MAVVILAAALVFAATPVITRVLWHNDNLTPLVRIALPNAIFLALASVPMTYFQSEKRFGQNAVVLGGQALFGLAGVGILALLGKWSVRTAILMMVVSTAIGAFRFLSRVPREAWWPRSSNREPHLIGGGFWKSPTLQASDLSEDHHKPAEFAFFLFVSSLIVLVSGKIDLWLIGTYLDVTQVGVYSAAGRLTLPLVIVLGAFNTVLLPRAASATTLEATRALAAKTFKASLLLAGLGAIYSILGPILIPLLFGSSYQSSVLIAQVLCLGL